ncbi:FxsB family radical SAM/SPASM domain protein [Streptomyces sp. NBC_01167]|uniref:FxsB family cyclophane-forming radical SAM/SPASM peptide maturase n=1 Tax=Streptomyces sp. NBC_01167 TaxID=2903756 RepID=UPI00386A5F33|nr:FxsB family radical SAM/SPASM domain protein [Streptomyces sp. NBC_01167]
MDRPHSALGEFVLKVHSRCDLACDHCYVYEHADSSWRGRPKAMPEKALEKSAERIAEHALAHGLSTVHVVMHGGEPLLAGLAGLRRTAQELHRALQGVCALDLRIHTNGVLLSERFCELFLEWDIKVGISLDGDKASNDRHRRYADGRSSHPQVLRAVELLRRPRYRELFSGLLCTIDVENDPVAVYDALVALEPPRLDFLLPHATWDTPPPRPGPSPTPYADWLGVIYRRWDEAGRPVPVRMFDSVLRTLRGETSLTESLGLSAAEFVVIETDGTFEQADSLKTAFDGAPVTGMDVFANSVDDVMKHPGMSARQSGIEQLSAPCRTCPVVNSCGGGLYAHRYRGDTGFDNPSVFCPDLMALITGIRDRVSSESARPARALRGGEIDQLDDLATGFGSVETVGQLVADQLDLHRRLLMAVGGRVQPSDAVATAAWEALAELDQEAPESVDAVVAHPSTRPWALNILKGRVPETIASGTAALAAAASLRARRGATVTVPFHDGKLRLPGLGTVALADTFGHAEVAAEADGFVVRSAGGSVRIGWGEGMDGHSPHWQPVRLVELPGWQLALEPSQDVSAEPLSATEAKVWAEDLNEAWALIHRHLPRYADGLSTGLRSVTPLPLTGKRGTSPSFGTADVIRTPTPDGLALSVMQGFQRVKLGAVLDRHDLHAPDATESRVMVLAAYSQLAAVEFWRVRRPTLEGDEATAAEHEFTCARQETLVTLGNLVRAGRLTPLGDRFVEGMTQALV